MAQATVLVEETVAVVEAVAAPLVLAGAAEAGAAEGPPSACPPSPARPVAGRLAGEGAQPDLMLAAS